MDDFITEPMRTLQDRFQTRRLAERVRERAFRTAFTNADRAMIENAMFFFIASVDATGRPQCSYKGGPRGFVRVTGDAEITFPLYEGNGLYLSAGNIAGTGRVDLLFIDFEKQSRLRVNGTACIDDHHPMLDHVRAVQVVVKVRVTDIHPNCSRHVHRMTLIEPSGSTPVESYQDVGKAAWGDDFADVLPAYMRPGQPAPEG